MNTGGPFESVAITNVGIMPRTELKNRYILTVVDHFTKHVEADALLDKVTGTITLAFLNLFVARYGVPYVIHTSQETDFESNIFKTL